MHNLPVRPEAFALRMEQESNKTCLITKLANGFSVTKMLLFSVNQHHKDRIPRKS